MKLHRVLGAVLVLLIVMLVIDCAPLVYRLFFPAKFQSHLTTFDGVDALPPAALIQSFIKAAENRRACESANGEHCLRNYKDVITSAIKEHTEDIPNMGAFILALEKCPTVFEHCMGGAEDIDLCMDRELRCIAFVYKMNWKNMSTRAQETQP